MLRVNRISDFTQYRGDQGRAYADVLEYWQAKTLPLVGPTVSIGQRPGPFYYYLIALPLILTGFDPLSPAVWMAVLSIFTVVSVFLLGSLLGGQSMGAVFALLYAVSPDLVVLDRSAWNPALVPFLTTLSWYAIISIRRKPKPWLYLLLGAALGLMIQLHLSTAFVVFAGFLFLVVDRKPVKHILLTVGSFILVLSPYIYYELTHAFVDLRMLLYSLLMPQAAVAMSISDRVQTVFRTGAHVMQFILPGGDRLGMYLFLGVIVGALTQWRRRITRFTLLYLLGGLVFVSVSSAHTYDHYLLFLLPAVLVLTGLTLMKIQKLLPVRLLWVAIIVIAGIQLSRLQLFVSKVGDIKRTQDAIQVMKTTAGTHPFSFTLSQTYSHSDYHYRFLFQRDGITPKPITDEASYDVLFLVCERDPCPSVEKAQTVKEVQILCFEKDCEPIYPVFYFDHWVFSEHAKVPGVSIYTYRKPDTVK